MQKKTISTDEAKGLIIQNAHTLDPVDMPVTDGEGSVLAEEIKSSVNLPYFTNSAMDGYAVKSRDIEGASPDSPAALTVIGAIRAGDSPNFVVGDGEAARIMTGAPVPKGADCVVMVEDTEVSAGGRGGGGSKGTDEVVQIKRDGRAGEYVRREGEEIKKGEVALERGAELNSASLGFIAELGIKEIKVYRRPKLCLIVTGDEVIGPDEELEPGKIRDAHSVSLGSAVARERARLLYAERAGDDLRDIDERVKRALGVCDILIVTGGISVGDYDHVREVFNNQGVEQIFWGVAQKPGMPLFFGKRDAALVFGLPGNPASSLVCFYEYVRPAIRRLMGKRDVFLLEIEALLSEDIRKQPGKTHYIRGYLEKVGGSFHVKPTGKQGSHVLQSFAQSNCLIVAPENAARLPANSFVKAHLLPD